MMATKTTSMTFLERIKTPGKERTIAILAAAAWLFGLLLLATVDPVLVLVVVPGTFLVLWWAARPTVPLYAMVATYPFIDLQIVVGSLNAPLVDMIATVALVAWGLRLAWFFMTDRAAMGKISFPGWHIFLVWILVAAISITNSFDWALSMKYWIRPLAFFYLVYVVYIVNVLKRPSDLWRILFILYVLGVLVALYGVYGFVLHPGPSLFDKRIAPADLFGFNPLGGNQNVIADVMVTTIPIGFFLMLHMKKLAQQKLIFAGLLLMIVVNLGTFSRTGWLALLLELLILVAFQYRHHLVMVLRYSVPALVLSLPLVGYMLYFSIQAPVQSSNENRLILNDVAWEMFSEKPYFGQGPGTFIPTLERNRVYIEEFGAPLDAHGIVQKVGSELGVLGLAAYLGLCLYALWRILVAYRRQPLTSDWSYLLISLLMMVAGTIFFQFFQTSYYVAKLWLPVGLALGAAAIALEKSDYRFDSR